MKPKYIVGAVVAILVVVGVVFAFNSNKVDYVDFATAESSGRKVQIAGTWVKEQGCTYDVNSNQFRFTMRDQKGRQLPVVFEGAKPNNFEISTSIVATGVVDGGSLKASNILTKCPSKYESGGEGIYPKGGQSGSSDPAGS